MMVATTCSCTSAPLSAPDLGRCVKARRSATKSLQIAALASLRPTICALPAERISFGSACEEPGLSKFHPYQLKKAVLSARPFDLSDAALASQNDAGPPAITTSDNWPAVDGLSDRKRRATGVAAYR